VTSDEIKITEVSPPKTSGTKAIANIARSAVRGAFLSFGEKADVRGSVDIRAENRNDDKEYSYTCYARLGFDMQHHDTRRIILVVGKSEYEVIIHAAVADRMNYDKSDIADELTDKIADKLLNDYKTEMAESSKKATLRYLISEFDGYFTKPMLLEAAKKIGIREEKLVGAAINTLIEDDLIEIEGVNDGWFIEEGIKIDPDFPGKVFHVRKR